MKKRILLILAVLILASTFVPALDVFVAAANPPSVTATSAAVIDFASGEVLFSKDADRMRPPASMTKNVTAYIVYEEIAAGRLTLDTMITVGRNAVNLSTGHDWHSATVFRTVGAQHSVETMLRLIMLPSHNGSCIALAEHISGSESAFVARMNELMQRMEINATFENSHGLWGNSVSALGMARFVRYFLTDFPDILRITAMRSMDFGGSSVPNTNRILSYAHIDGFKTGTTGAAGPCLSSTAFRGDVRVVAVTMNSSNTDTRFSDSLRLLNFGLDEAEYRAAERERERIAAEEAARVNVTIDGTQIEFDVHARTIDGSVMAPVRAIAEALGALVTWDGETENVTITTVGGDVISAAIGSQAVYINNISFEKSAASVLIGGRTFWPVRFTAERLGASVIWDGDARTVHILSP